MHNIYLDHAAATPIDPRVLQAMRPFLSSEFCNPSSLYDLGVRVRKAIDESRKTIAKILHTTPDTITFTSGGTEANNLAILGVAKIKKGHIITTPIEHDSVLGPIEQLKKEGCNITYLKIDKDGLVNPNEVIGKISPDTVFISIMYANNEIGTIEPIAEIGRKILRYRKERNTPHPYFHVDACQATGYLELDVEKLHVDLMTINGSKIYGPKGIGLLYVRRGIKIEPIMFGGGQERGLRPGTENVAGIVGLAKALEAAHIHRDEEIERVRKLSRYFWNQLQENIPGIKLHGPAIDENRLPNNLNIEFPRVEGEALLLYLNETGVMCSTGSACGLESNKSSHVLRSIGLAEKQIKGSIRFSLGRGILLADIKKTISKIKKIIALLYGQTN